jgi:hypothetical protein
MAKLSGVGSNFYIGGYDLSGDVAVIDTIHGGHALKEVTTIADVAVERMTLHRDGDMSWSTWFDVVAGAEHPVLSPIPATDVLCTACIGTTLGAPAASMIAKQASYDGTRGSDGSMSFKVQAFANAYGIDWGQQLTTGKQTFTGTTNGTAVDLGVAEWATPVTITSNTNANPTVILTSGPHGLVTGDSVTISGQVTGTPLINGDYPVTYSDATHFTIPVNVTVAGGTAALAKTSTDFGACSYLQAFTRVGTSYVVKVQHSADSAGTDTWADVAGLSHTSVTTVPVFERMPTTTATGIIKRWARLVITGTFSSGAVNLVLTRYGAVQG